MAKIKPDEPHCLSAFRQTCISNDQQANLGDRNSTVSSIHLSEWRGNTVSFKTRSKHYCVPLICDRRLEGIALPIVSTAVPLCRILHYVAARQFATPNTCCWCRDRRTQHCTGIACKGIKPRLCRDSHLPNFAILPFRQNHTIIFLQSAFLSTFC